ncbi:DedA family protein, partial [Candidatus Saccharibacteria bacterium]|nr:DedA family protein [Candidatus Saccharibacteria bacterium]
MIVAAIIFAENGLLIGFFFPGDSMLITLGLLIQDLNKQHSQLDINLAVLVLIAAAIAGSYVGYIFGKKIGPRLFTRQNSLLFKQENIQRAQEFYNRFGGKTIILARFVPIVRTFVPLIAGIAKMDSRQFMIYNILGGAIWISSIT